MAIILKWLRSYQEKSYKMAIILPTTARHGLPKSFALFHPDDNYWSKYEPSKMVFEARAHANKTQPHKTKH